MPNPVVIPDELTFAQDGQRANSRASATSIVTQPFAEHGPHNAQLMQTMPNPPVQSDEQGFGRSPGQQWPHMPRALTFNFDQLANARFRDGGPAVIQQYERQGWSAPDYYQQAVDQHHVFPMPISIEQAPTSPYTAIAQVPA